jgi:hypothetical protein
VQKSLRARSLSLSSRVSRAVGEGFDTLPMPAIGTGSNVRTPAGCGSFFGSRSRTGIRATGWPTASDPASVVSYPTLPSAVATRVPAGMLMVPELPPERANSTSPAALPPVTRSIPSSATTLSSAAPEAVSMKPDWYTKSSCAESDASSSATASESVRTTLPV